MVAGGGVAFGGWGMAKAAQRAARLMQEFDAQGLLPDTLNAHATSESSLANGNDPTAAVDAKGKRPHPADPFALGTGHTDDVSTTTAWRAAAVLEFSRIRRALKRVVCNAWFSRFLLAVIAANCITIAIDASLPQDQTTWTDSADALFLGIYLTEFILKIIVDPKGYWKSGYNKFDALVLAISLVQFVTSFLNANIGNLTFLRVFRALRALRSFRSVSSIRRLQIIVEALLRTLRYNALDIFVNLFVFLFLFAVMGYYLFGMDSGGDTSDFGSLGMAMLSLMYYVTSSGWVGVQDNLTQAGFAGSEYYSIIFMVISNFIFANMFIGVICENIDEASEADRESQLRIKLLAQQQKKDAFRVKQRNDMRELLARTDFSNNSNSMQKVLESLAGTLRHDEVVPMTHMACNLTWLEAFMVTQYHLENSMYRCQQTHFAIANALTELLDRRLKNKASRGA
ncbi:Cation channel sperm-associated protein 3 [Allomyces arbusculus]|nr:Cation channel sperm-associated protein 3 [Allomyces arbusculus]